MSVQQLETWAVRTFANQLIASVATSSKDGFQTAATSDHILQLWQDCWQDGSTDIPLHTTVGG